MNTDEALRVVAEIGLVAQLTTGPVSRCYLYLPDANPDLGRGWVGYGDSRESLAEAIAKALEQAAGYRLPR